MMLASVVAKSTIASVIATTFGAILGKWASIKLTQPRAKNTDFNIR